ncbi:MAG: SDR family NAD(P)-dependent oxidoreductase [Sphingomonadaceae bacterium]
MDLQLAGQKALIIGGTRGIGRATARLLAAEGVTVAFCGRGAAAAEALAAEIPGSIGFAADAGGDGAAFRQALADAIGRLGGLDILVTCQTASGMKFDEAGFRENFEVDLIGTYRAIEVALPHLKQSRNGNVINIASIAALEEFGGPQTFNSIKTATIVYLHQLAHAHAPVRFNTVSPGPIYEKEGPWGYVEANMPEVFGQVRESIPMKRYGLPEEVAAAIAFLASPRAGFISGTNLVIDGAAKKAVQF